MSSSRSGKVNISVPRKAIRPIEPEIRPVTPSLSARPRQHSSQQLPEATPKTTTPKNAELRSKLTTAAEDLKRLRESAESLCRTVLARVADPQTRAAAETVLKLVEAKESR